LFVNASQPSFKLAEKAREGAQVTKCYKLLTPFDWLLTDSRVAETTRARMVALVWAHRVIPSADLDPILLPVDIGSAQQTLIALARIAASTLGQTVPIDAFISGCAWLGGMANFAQLQANAENKLRRRHQTGRAVGNIPRPLAERLVARCSGV
jgi:hypothetical protein